MSNVTNLNNFDISYEDIRKAMGDEPYTMELARSDGLVVEAAVNRNPIDSHLEACYVPERGDSYAWNDGGYRLHCTVSAESMPVLLRRLTLVEDDDGEAESLADSILTSLGFDEYGEFVGREALGLE